MSEFRGSIPKAPSATPKPAKRIPPRSSKRRKQEAQYLRDREVFLTTRSRCEMKLHCCTAWATEVHHMRGRDGDRLLDQDWWMPGCNACHHAVTVNPQMAYDRGLSVHRNGAA